MPVSRPPVTEPYQPTYSPPPPGQPKPPSKVKRNLIIGGLALLVLFIGIGIGGGSSKAKTVAGKTVTVNTTTTDTATISVTTTPTQVVSTVSVTATVTYTPSLVNQFSDGTYVVGTDIPAGTYHTAGAEHCYWARLKDLTGGLDSISANDNITGPTTVRIPAGDKGFEVSGGCSWSQIG